jgi:hypothetical protein
MPTIEKCATEMRDRDETDWHIVRGNCGQPIATEAERTWSGDDPVCGPCGRRRS